MNADLGQEDVQHSDAAAPQGTQPLSIDFLKWLAGITALTFLALAEFAYSDQTQEVCPGVVIKGHEKVKLNDTEMRLVCGEQSDKEPYADAWSFVPPSQAKFHLTAFLQERGYQHPRFEEKDDKLFATLGESTVVSKVAVDETPKGFFISRKRKIMGERLTPALLNELESWSESELKELGYACATTATAANKDTGEVLLSLTPNLLRRITAIEEKPIAGLQNSALTRFYAFRVGDFYQHRAVKLTERRILNQDIVSSIYYRNDCSDPAGVKLIQETVDGPPRLFKIGFGFNTEQGFLGRLSWRHARFDKNASLAEVDLSSGFRTQEFRSDLWWYYRDKPSNIYLHPSFKITRERENLYEALTTVTSLAPGYGWKTQNTHFLFELGPGYRVEKTIVGVGPGDSRSFTLEGLVQQESHDFEFYRPHPRDGYRWDVTTSIANRGVLSPFTADRVNFHGEFLWNFRDYDPPLWIFGIRTGLGTTFTDRLLEENPDLPTAFRHFLGGSSDLRGFDRKELPGFSEGALTEAYVGLEARFADLPWHLEPFVFDDIGQMGVYSFSLNTPLFYSPGLGLRWDSPIGVFRGTASHGYLVPANGEGVKPNLSHWQFYLAYGEEF